MFEIGHMYKATEHQPLWFRWVTTPISLLYAIAVRMRNAAYELGVMRSRSLPGRVISVGNIAVGGTGKTPFCVLVCSLLKAQGASPAIISRGYRSQLRSGDSAAFLGGNLVMKPQFETELFADEAMMQSMQLPDVPVVIGRDRHAAVARYLADHQSDVSYWVLDDGFQHRRIRRDLDVVLMDSRNPFGEEWLLPRGFLRESLRSLFRADLVVFTRAIEGFPSKNVVDQMEKTTGRPGMVTTLATGEPKLMCGEGSLDAGCNLVCAVARPDSVLSSVENSGIRIRSTLVKSDHQRFDKNDILARIDRDLPVLTTEKDYWRDPGLFRDLGVGVYILPVSMLMDSGDVETLQSLLMI